MALSPAQMTSLLADIAANTATVNVQGTPTQIKNVVRAGDTAALVAAWYNASAGFKAWDWEASKALVDAQIVKANFTPADSPPAATNTTQGTNDGLLYQNRALLCQLKQFNSQWLTSGPGSINTGLLGVRQNFKDALTAIPSGASGANTEAGWGTAGAPGAVRLQMQRDATRLQKLFATAPGTGPGNVAADALGATTNPGVAGYTGTLGDDELNNAWGG